MFYSSRKKWNLFFIFYRFLWVFRWFLSLFIFVSLSKEKIWISTQSHLRTMLWYYVFLLKNLCNSEMLFSQFNPPLRSWPCCTKKVSKCKSQIWFLGASTKVVHARLVLADSKKAGLCKSGGGGLTHLLEDMS